MEKTIEKGWKEIKAHLLSLVKKNNEENLQNWLERTQYCLERMGAMEFGMDFEHNIKVFLGLDNVYHEIQDKIVKETLVQLLRELSPILGMAEHKLFALTDSQVRETLLPGGAWLMRKSHCNVRRNKNSYTMRISNPKSMTKKEMKQRMEECLKAIDNN